MKIVPKKILSILAIGFSGLAYADRPPTPGIPGGPGGPPRVPVDSGIALLFAAAVLYSFYKIYQYNKNKKASI